MGALSVTGTAHYREPFEPLIGGVKFADFNDLESVKARSQTKPAPFSQRWFRGKAEFYPADPGFLQGLSSSFAMKKT